MRRWWKRFIYFYLKRYPLVGQAGLLGIIFVLVGALASSKNWQTFLLGTGSSLIAAALFSFVNYIEQATYQQFVGLGITGVYAFRDTVPIGDWCVWLRRVRHNCVLFGIANHNWCEDKDFEKAVLEVVRRKVEIKVFFLDPTAAVAEVRSREELRARGRNTIQVTRDSIRYMWQMKQRLGPVDGAFFRLYAYEGTPSGTNWFDNFMIVTHYLAGSANVNSPSLRIESTYGTEDLFTVYKENIEKVEEHSSHEITPDNVGTYT